MLKIEMIDEAVVEDYLLEDGIMPHLRGFPCLVASIKYYLSTNLLHKTGVFYEPVAKELGVTPECLVRNMKHAITTSKAAGKRLIAPGVFSYIAYSSLMIERKLLKKQY